MTIVGISSEAEGEGRVTKDISKVPDINTRSSEEDDYNTDKQVRRDCENGNVKSEENINNKNSNEFEAAKNIPVDNHNLTKTADGKASFVDARLEEYTEKSNKTERSRIIRDVVMVSLAFMIHFTAFIGTSNLQSSVNAAGGLGTTSLMTLYVGMSLSAIFLPVAMIKWLGCKWTLVLSLVAYIPYIAAQVYAEFYTLIPAAVLVGLGAGPLWCAQSVYINVVAEIYAELKGLPPTTFLARFFGIFFMLYQTSEVWGNLISSSVLSSKISQEENRNFTTSENVRATCGYNFCPDSKETEKNPNLERPPEEEIYTIAGIYLACMILACLVVIFGVTSLKRYNKNESTNGKGASGIHLMIVTFKLLSDHRLLLLIPLTIWMGIEQVFRGADYTSGYVSCSWGISNIGYVLICYGITNSMASFVTGYLVKLTGRILMVILATVIQIGITMTLYIWTPDPANSSAVFFIISGLWGVTDAIWLVQITALYGTLFPGNEVAAYSNFRTWKSAGFILAYAYSPYLCTSIKLHIMLIMLIVGAIGFCIVEWLIRQHGKKN